MLTTGEKEKGKINRNSTTTYLLFRGRKKKKRKQQQQKHKQNLRWSKQASSSAYKKKKPHVPSPSLSKRLKASLNSAICSSVNCSTMLSGLESLSSCPFSSATLWITTPPRARTQDTRERERERERGELAGVTGKKRVSRAFESPWWQGACVTGKTRRMGPTHSSPYFSARFLVVSQMKGVSDFHP